MILLASSVETFTLRRYTCESERDKVMEREEVSERGKDQVARSLNTSGRASPRDVFKQINSEPTWSLTGSRWNLLYNVPCSRLKSVKTRGRMENVIE